MGRGSAKVYHGLLFWDDHNGLSVLLERHSERFGSGVYRERVGRAWKCFEVCGFLCVDVGQM